MSTRSTYNQPFCWQEKNVLRLLKSKYNGETLSKLRNLYLTLTQIDSDFTEKNFKWYTKSISTYSGLSKRWIPKGLKILNELNIIEIKNGDRDELGRFTMKNLKFTPEKV